MLDDSSDDHKQWHADQVPAFNGGLDVERWQASQHEQAWASPSSSVNLGPSTSASISTRCSSLGSFEASLRHRLNMQHHRQQQQHQQQPPLVQTSDSLPAAPAAAPLCKAGMQTRRSRQAAAKHPVHPRTRPVKALATRQKPLKRAAQARAKVIKTEPDASQLLSKTSAKASTTSNVTLHASLSANPSVDVPQPPAWVPTAHPVGFMPPYWHLNVNSLAVENGLELQAETPGGRGAFMQARNMDRHSSSSSSRQSSQPSPDIARLPSDATLVSVPY